MKELKVKRGNSDNVGDYYIGHYYTEATRSIHGQANTWAVYDKRSHPEWYDDNAIADLPYCRIAEFNYLKDAKAYMINNTTLDMKED